MKKTVFATAMFCLASVPLFASDTFYTGVLVWLSENKELTLTLGSALFSLSVYLLPAQYAEPLTLAAKAVKWAMEKLIWAGNTKGGFSNETTMK